MGEALPAPARPEPRAAERAALLAALAPAAPPALPEPSPEPSPEPLREATRRFLRPRVGLDPADVRVFRGPAAGRLAADLGADALAGADAVALPPAVDEATPAGLGLIAHELSHVASARAPRFVPPLPPHPAPLARAPHDADPEERAAGAVEAATAAAARAAQGAPPPAAQGAPPPRPAPAAPPADWGGLPAPWEPLPTPAAAAPPAPSQPAAPPAPQPAPAPQAAQAPAAPLRRADTGRSVPNDPPAETAPARQLAAEPDLDALARQVYAVLKQRLATERRRMS